MILSIWFKSKILIVASPISDLEVINPFFSRIKCSCQLSIRGLKKRMIFEGLSMKVHKSEPLFTLQIGQA
jgi:hypothetical protein